METKMKLSKCKCSLRTKLVGDGCSICNPEYWKELIDKVEEDYSEHPELKREDS